MRPVIILAAITVAATVIQILVSANQVCKPSNPLGFVVVNPKVQIWRAAIGLAAVDTHARKLSLKVAFISSVALELSWR